MQTAASETESNSRYLSICVHHYTLRAPCPKGQGILTEKRRWGSGGRCQIIHYDSDNALHGPIARDKTERKPRNPSRRSIVRRLQLSSANRMQATLNFNLADLCESGWTL